MTDEWTNPTPTDTRPWYRRLLCHAFHHLIVTPYRHGYWINCLRCNVSWYTDD